MWKWVGVWFALLFATGAARAVEPQFIRISPDLRVYPQYFTVEQDRSRHLFVGGSGGVLRFDGSRWTWLKMPEPGAVRALYADADGRLWVGGSECFGYMRAREDGGLEFVDLAPRFQRDLGGEGFADIWDISEFEGRIYFRALRDLFAVDATGARVGYWRHDGRFGEIGRVGDELWLQWRGEGLRRLSGDTFVPIPGTAGLAKSLIYNLLPLTGGGVLITDVSGRLKLFRNGRLEILDDASLTDDVLRINNGVALGGDRFAFGGSDGAIRILDLPARRFDVVAVGNRFIPELMLDDDGALMGVDEQGLIRVEWPYRWLRYGSADDIRGSVYALQRIDDAVYFSTGNGAFRAPIRGGAIEFPMSRLDWTVNEAWAVAKDEAGLLFAESRTLNRIVNGRAEAISADDLYPRVLLVDPGRPGYLWVGSEFGPVLMKAAGSGYVEVGRETRAPWLVSSLAATPDGILLGSEEKGLAMANFDPRRPDDLRVTRFGPVQGLRYGEAKTARVSAMPGGVVVSTEAGLFRYRANAFVEDDLDGLGGLLDDGEVVALSAADNGDHWAYSFHTVYRKPAAGRWAAVLQARSGDGPFLSMIAMPDGDAFFAASGTMVRFLHRTDAAATVASGTPASRATLRISGARLYRAGGEVDRLPLDRAPGFLMAGASLEFDLALTDYSGSDDKRFQFRLEGFDDAWSDVGARPSVRFFSLPPGKYVLHVRARVGVASAITAPPYAFEVIPRWYERAWFPPAVIGMASLIVVFALILRQRRRVAALHSRNAELDALVRARTHDLEQLNLGLRDLADRDGLTGIANRRKFDAVLQAAMAQAQASRSPLGLALIDVDHFKAYNDANGHQAGDDALIRVARCLSECARDGDLVARYGGEEFAMVAPGCGADDVWRLAERIRHRVEVALGVTVSIGIGELHPGETPADFVARADAALYQAKSAGRNRVA